MTLRLIALLGKRDTPADAVEEYCGYLGGALQAHDLQVESAASLGTRAAFPSNSLAFSERSAL